MMEGIVWDLPAARNQVKILIKIFKKIIVQKILYPSGDSAERQKCLVF